MHCCKRLSICLFADSRAYIPGNRDLHVNSGSALRLHCHVQRSSGPPKFVFWYRNGDVINYAGRDNVIISTAPAQSLQRIKMTKDDSLNKRPRWVSSIEIKNVTSAEDAGVYTCAPSNAKNYSIVVHVVQGQYRLNDPVAIYRGFRKYRIRKYRIPDNLAISKLKFFY